MADASTAHIDILRDIAQSKADIAAAVADMHVTVIRTRALLQQARKLVAQDGAGRV